MSASAGGVRNLRAMFENQSTSEQSNSSPSRGRSSSGSAVSAGSRPVSKVRASFVAVERPKNLAQGQQWGLRKASDVSSMAEVRDEAREENNIQPVMSADVFTEERQAPESPHLAKTSVDGGLGSILKGSAFEGTPRKEQASESQMNGSPKKEESHINGVASRAAAMVEKMKPNDRAQPPPSTKLQTTPTAYPVKAPHPRYAQTAQSPSSPKANSPKTPTSPAATRMNIRGGPAKIRSVMESAKRASEGREAAKKEQEAKSPVTSKPQTSPKTRAPARLPSAVSATTAASDGHRAASEQPQKPAARPRTSTVQPARLPSVVHAKTAASKAHTATETNLATKPRSSAPPARLPSAVTAKTASSLAKKDAEPVRKASTRQSLSMRPTTKTTAAATAGTASTLAKKSSRASLTNGGDRPKSRVSSKPDESFLSRMARPTASSASKVHDKVDSPPRAKSKPNAAHRTSQAPRRSDQSQATSEAREPNAEKTPP